MTTYTDSVSKLIDNTLFDEFPESDFFKEALKSISSTQQLNLDWSKFENHTFFNSAVSNVNTAFDKLVNGYPIDGTKKEVIDFVNSLTGFEKYILDTFPKNTGYLQFNKSLPNSIDVKDIKNSGIVIKESAIVTGEKGLNPGSKSFSIEAHIYAEDAANLNQIVLQKLESNNIGFSLVLEENLSTTACNIQFIVTTAEIVSYVSAPIVKGKFNHICAIFDRDSETSTLKILVNGVESTNDLVLEVLNINPTNNYLTIGYGNTTKITSTTTFTQGEYFDGYIDELRLYHKAISWDSVEPKAKKQIFQDDDLVLYFRFNEPFDAEAAVNTPNIVIDSSGNGFHSVINNFDSSLRDNPTSIVNPIEFEDEKYFPILFPNNTLVQTFNTSLLTSAILYDDNNPNLITKLVPPHYFLDGMNETISNESGFGTILNAYEGDKPNSGKLGTAQMLTSVLLIWGKFFDEIKIVTDNFSNLLNVEYSDEESAINTFLTFVAKYYGFDLPTIFPEASWEQFAHGENTSDQTTKAQTALSYIQSQIWRRILVNLKDIYKSKGTINSIKSFLLSAGIDPNSLLRLREYGGNLKNDIKYSREEKIETSTMLDFSGSLSTTSTGVYDSDGIYEDLPYIKSGFLSGSRLEVGFPEPQGTMQTISSHYPTPGILATSVTTPGLAPADGHVIIITMTSTSLTETWTRGTTTTGIWEISSGTPDFSVTDSGGIVTITSLFAGEAFNGSATIEGVPLTAIAGGTNVIPVADLESRHGISDDINDGLFTSGSFLFEGIYSFPVDREYSSYQSLIRVNADGKSYNNVVLNVVAHSSSIDPANHELKCFITPTNTTIPSVPKIELVITGVNIFDGSKWNIAAGRDRFDEIEDNVSSSYYMKCTRQMFGDIKEYHSASSYYEELDHSLIYAVSTNTVLSLTLPVINDTITWTPTGGALTTSTYDGSDWSNPTGYSVVVTEGGGFITDIVITVTSGTSSALNTVVPTHTDGGGSGSSTLLAAFVDGIDGSDIFSKRDGNFNEYGHFLSIGKQNFATTPEFLNSFGPSSTEMTTEFEGKVGHLRMWSKGFTDDEWKEHVRNYTSLGVVSPFDNFNFNTHATGSFQRLRVDASTDQSTTAANASGEIQIFDYSQNEKHLSGTGFELENTVIKPENFYFNIISPKYDLLQSSNKIRARGFIDEDNVKNSANAIQGLVHEIPLYEKFFDDARFAVEFSSIDALNEDIVKMFSSLDVINNILGQPNLMFSDSYIDLENLQKIYFNRLTGKLDIDAYLGIFKWFDEAYTKIIKQLLPKKTKYMGTNFIIESHMLERNRFKYLFDDIYMNSSERDNSRGNIFLSQIVGSIKKF